MRCEADAESNAGADAQPNRGTDARANLCAHAVAYAQPDAVRI